MKLEAKITSKTDMDITMSIRIEFNIFIDDVFHSKSNVFCNPTKYQEFIHNKLTEIKSELEALALINLGETIII